MIEDKKLEELLAACDKVLAMDDGGNHVGMYQEAFDDLRDIVWDVRMETGDADKANLKSR